MDQDEPAITINGTRLTVAQAMTMRVALETFFQDLHENGLGKDEVGRAICEGYKSRVVEIATIMHDRERR